MTKRSEYKAFSTLHWKLYVQLSKNNDACKANFSCCFALDSMSLIYNIPKIKTDLNWVHKEKQVSKKQNETS